MPGTKLFCVVAHCLDSCHGPASDRELGLNLSFPVRPSELQFDSWIST